MRNLLPRKMPVTFVALFISMCAMAQDALAVNTAVIDGEEKPILSVSLSDRGKGNFNLWLYVNEEQTEFIALASNPAYYEGKDIDLTKKQETKLDYWEWSVGYVKPDAGWLFWTDGGYNTPTFAVFDTGTMRIEGDVNGTLKIVLINGTVTDTSHGDGQPHTFSFSFDSTVTAIPSPATADEQKLRSGIYNLQGVHLGNDLSSLPAGLYIKDGKKVLKNKGWKSK